MKEPKLRAETKTSPVTYLLSKEDLPGYVGRNSVNDVVRVEKWEVTLGGWMPWYRLKNKYHNMLIPLNIYYKPCPRVVYKKFGEIIE